MRFTTYVQYLLITMLMLHIPWSLLVDQKLDRPKECAMEIA